MIYLCNKEGLIVASVPSAVNQGSIGVNEIVLIAPFPSTSVVSLAFTLPNGVLVHPQAVPYADSAYPYNMTLSQSFENLLEGGYNVWTSKLNKTLTQVAGTARISFLITDQYGETLSTPSTQFNINKSSGYILDVTEDDLSTLASYVAIAQAAAANAEESYQKFKNENRYDIVYNSDDIGYDRLFFQEWLLNSVREYSGSGAPSILIKNTMIEGLTQDELEDLDVTLSDKALKIGTEPPSETETFADRFIYIPAGVSLITFSGCGFIGSGEQSYNTCICTDLDNTCKIEIDNPRYSETLNAVSVACFNEVDNTNASLIANCEKVHNCTTDRIVGCLSVSDCSAILAAPITVEVCEYVDFQSIPNIQYIDTYGGSALDLYGKTVALGDGATEGKILPLVSDLSGNLEGNALTLYLNYADGEQGEPLSIELPLSSIYRYKGSVRTFANLPSGAEIGDVYNVEEAYGSYAPGTNFAWNGTTWDALGGSVDLSGYLTRTEFNATIGDISTALDDIISIQESLIGGNNV